MAPELLRRKGQPSEATDVYALGITMSEVFARAEPYAEVSGTTAEILARVAGVGGAKPLRPVVGDSVPPLFAALMARCWHADAAVRPSMAMVDAELRLAAADSEATSDSMTAALNAATQRHAGERKLLHALFPPAVAAALAEGRRVEPQEFDCVTVFFSDIVGECMAGNTWKLLTPLLRLHRHVRSPTACQGDGHAGPPLQHDGHCMRPLQSVQGGDHRYAPKETSRAFQHCLTPTDP